MTTVIRCLKLLSVPQKYLDRLFEEEKLSEIGVKPTQTTLTEDFFLEMLGTISSLKSDDVGEKIYKKYGEEKSTIF